MLSLMKFSQQHNKKSQFNSSMFHLTAPKHQLGLTLVELLVASALGLIFITAMIRVYLDAKQSYTVNTAKTVLHEESRATFRILDLAIAQAGYRNGRSLKQNSQTIFPSDAPFAANQVIIAQGDTNGAWQLTTRFQGNDDGLVSDCLGNRYGDDHLIVQVLSYDPTFQRLSCQVSCATFKAELLNCPVQSAVITEHLRAFELLVGLDGNPVDNSPEQYEPIDSLTGLEVDILAIKALGWFESKLNIHHKDQPQTLIAFNGTRTENDRKLRLAFSETFSARNRLP